MIGRRQTAFSKPWPLSEAGSPPTLNHQQDYKLVIIQCLLNYSRLVVIRVILRDEITSERPVPNGSRNAADAIEHQSL